MLISDEFGIIEPTSSEGISIGFDGERLVIYEGDTPTMWSKYLIDNVQENLMEYMLESIANEIFYDLRGITFVYTKTETSDKALDFLDVNGHLQKQNRDNAIFFLCGDTASIQLNNDIKRSSLDLDIYLGDLSAFA